MHANRYWRGYGIFCEEVRKISDIPLLVIEPSPALAAVCLQKGLHVIQSFLENVKQDDLPGSRNVFVCFELFEHLHSPALFMESFWRIKQPGDYLILTTLSGVGFDIEMLGQHSKSIHPPHHVTFLNPLSMASFLRRLGFVVLQIQTPGQLDVDIAFKQCDQISDGFWQVFLKNSPSEQRDQLQALLAANQLSSHMLAICRKI